MKRMIGTVAAVALLAASAANAQNTIPEIHQYFTVANAAGLAGPGLGGLSTNPAVDTLTNPAIVASPGTSVYLAVWIRALRGNTGASATQINSYNYEVTGQGDLVAFSTGGGDANHRRQRLVTGYSANGPDPAAAVDYVDLPGADSQLFGQSGGTAASGTILDNSGGDFGGAFLIDVIKIDILAGALPNSHLNIYMATPQSTSANHYATNGTAPSLNTIAFGADGLGGMDRKRASLPTQDMVGSAADRVSLVPDAVITVVPEPGTLGLLALGLLGLRRRKLA